MIAGYLPTHLHVCAENVTERGRTNLRCERMREEVGYGDAHESKSLSYSRLTSVAGIFYCLPL